MPKFIPGLKLSGMFYKEIVKPLMETYFPKIPYSAALIGYGSEVLGFDTPQSRDHEWGPRLRLFLTEEDYRQYSNEINQCFQENLPYTFKGYSTNFGPQDEDGVGLPQEIDSGPVNHRIYIHTIRGYFEDILGINPYDEIQILDWLTFPQQILLEITAGEVYFDGLNQLHKMRKKFSYYPDGVWRYILAAQWGRIAREEAFVGRCEDVGDELGSQIIAAGIIRQLMKLCFLMEKRYAPYSKWLGSAFAKLSCAEKLTPVFKNVLRSTSWKEREKHLSQAYREIARLHNALGITAPLDTSVSLFHNRPYLVIHAGRFAEEIRKSIKNEELRKLKMKIGAIDQLTDWTDLIGDPKLVKKFQVLYDALNWHCVFKSIERREFIYFCSIYWHAFF